MKVEFFKKKSDFEKFRLLKTKKAVGPFFVSYWIDHPENQFKIGLSVKKQRNQIIRNRIRRVIKSVCVDFAKHHHLPIQILFVVSRPLSQSYVKGEEFKEELVDFLLKMSTQSKK